MVEIAKPFQSETSSWLMGTCSALTLCWDDPASWFSTWFATVLIIVSYKASIFTGDPPRAQVNKVKLIDYNTMKQSLSAEKSAKDLKKAWRLTKYGNVQSGQ